MLLINYCIQISISHGTHSLLSKNYLIVISKDNNYFYRMEKLIFFKQKLALQIEFLKSDEAQWLKACVPVEEFNLQCLFFFNEYNF